jgi:hypothetical protein
MIDRVHQAAAARDGNPAAAGHFEGAAGLQWAAGKHILQLHRADAPVRGKAMENQILEKHGRVPRKNKRGLY